jgi:DNA-binding NtrC family response regulator
MDENCYRVLLLESESVIGRATSRALATEGFEVDSAVNGLIAKDKIDANKEYEFLIFDIKTPAMNGSQLYEYLEQDHPELTKRVIFTTGDSLGEVTKKFPERVNRPFLSKPYTPTQLRGLIREVFSISAPRL